MEPQQEFIPPPVSSDPFIPQPSDAFDTPAPLVPQKEFKPYQMKRLIVCCDGTWQSSNHGVEGVPSNIAKLARALAKFQRTKEGDFIHQVVFYDAGVGTATDTVVKEDRGWFDIKDNLTAKFADAFAKWQGGVGKGLDENVCEAYNFLVNNFNPGDEIYLFGFSRGAYTARAVAGLVARVGLCQNAEMDLFPAMWKAYKSKDADADLADTEWGKSPTGAAWLAKCDKTNIKAVGVFDTVGSLGLPDNDTVDVSKFNKEYGFHNTKIHPEIEYAFHALALDERRRPFSPTLWSIDRTKNKTTKKLVQCWFPGVHINIGGGSLDSSEKAERKGLEKGDFESMANITFAWMVDRLQEHTELGFDFIALQNIVKRYEDGVMKTIKKYNESVQKPNEKPQPVYRGWGVSPYVDSFDGMKATGELIRTPGNYPEKGETEEFIHPVVAHALDKEHKHQYNPPAMKDFVRLPTPDQPKDGQGIVWKKADEPANGKGYVWKKTYIIPEVKKGAQKTARKERVVIIPEFVIPPETGRYPSMERWLMQVDMTHCKPDQNGKMVEQTSLARTDTGAARGEAVKSSIKFLAKLDEDNGFGKPQFDENGHLIPTFRQGGFVVQGEAAMR